MNTLKDYVNFRLTHADKVAEAEGYPLKMQNCKKYKKMRDLKVYGNSFQDGTPTPDAPIEVVSVGEKSVNLFNKNKVWGGYINDANGEYRPTADGTSYASDYIEIPPNQKFYITHTETHQWAAAYDENKQFVKGIYGYGRFHESPSNAKYIRITVRADYIDTMQVQLGSTAIPYEPYGKYKIPVVQKGKNLVKDVREAFKTFADYTELEEDGRQCIRIKSHGEARAIFDFTFKENTQYTISFDFKCKYDRSGISLSYDTPFFIFYTDGNIEYLTLSPIDNTWRKRVYTTKANKTISHIQQRSYDYRVYDYIDINTFQIAEGTDGEYEPYIEPVTTNIYLDEPLRKTGDYADYIDFKGNKVIRRNKEVIPKPEDMTYDYKAYGEKYGYYIYGIGTRFYDAYVDDFYSWDYTALQPEKSTHFEAYPFRQTDMVKTKMWYINNAYSLRFHLPPEFAASDGISSNIPDIQAWVQSQIDAGTPLKFTYRLAEPIEEPLNIDLPKLNAKTTIIEVDTSLAPSNAYGKYIKK